MNHVNYFSVSNIISEPLPGWTDNLNGTTGLYYAASLGNIDRSPNKLLFTCLPSELYWRKSLTDISLYTILLFLAIHI